MYKNNTIAVVIPAYNEEQHIKAVVQSIPDFVDQIIVIDDGSSDKTGRAASEAGAFVIRHECNRGVGAALHTGIDYVLKKDFDIMVNVDGDEQFSPSDIVHLLEPIINDETDFVTASRFVNSTLVPDMPAVKRWGNRMMARLVNFLTRTSFSDVSCGFRAYSKETLLKLNLSGKFTYTHETFLDLAFKHVRIMEIPVKVTYFETRKSRISKNVIWYAFRALSIILRTYRDYKPLKFFWLTAGFFFLTSLFFFSVIVIHYMRSGFFTGHIWAGFVGAFFFMIGIFFFAMGIHGDMYARIRENQEKILIRIKRTESLLINSDCIKLDNGNNHRNKKNHCTKK
jgi:glycosyltransferase involved in cell wall biosynthesis